MPIKVVSRARTPFLYLRGTLRGRSICESTGVTDPGRAEDIRIKREAEILHESIYGRAAAANFAEAALSYLENGGRYGAGGSKRFMEPVLAYFKTTSLAKIDLEAIERGARITYPKASPPTRNRQFITPTVAVLRHAAKRGCALCRSLRARRRPMVWSAG